MSNLQRLHQKETIINGFEGDVLAGLPEESCLQDANVPPQGRRIDVPQLMQQAGIHSVWFRGRGSPTQAFGDDGYDLLFPRAWRYRRAASSDMLFLLH